MSVLELVRRRPIATFVVLNTVPSVCLVAAARTLGWSPALAGALAFPLNLSPVATAYLITAVAEGPEGTARLTSRFRPRGSPVWIAVALLVFAALAGLAHLTLPLLEGGDRSAGAPRTDGLLGALAMTPFLCLFPGLTEEPGWRGFLQPRLQRRLGAFGASVAVGLVWAVWHGFDLARRPDRFQLDTYPVFVAYTVSVAVVLGWLHNHTGGSVAVAILGHFGANVVNFFVPMGDAWVPYFALLGGFALLLPLVLGPSLRGWRVPARSLPADDPDRPPPDGS